MFCLSLHTTTKVHSSLKSLKPKQKKEEKRESNVLYSDIF